MQTIRVELGERSYDIVIGHDHLDTLGERVAACVNPSRALVISDDRVAAHYARPVTESLAAAGVTADLVTFPAGESSKCLNELSTLYDRMLEIGLDRKSAVIALGGGVTGDLAGYAAASYMRGIPFVQVPTSLLAMVDSSSGGKTGINHPLGKNMIGAFHQPRLVWIDTQTLKTLPRAELLCGLAEAVKHGMIRDEAYLAEIESNADALLALEPNALASLVAGSCRIKGGIVSADEREAGVRALLNFGHTFGHAYESLSGYEIRHGEAVAMGMMAACHAAERILEAPAGIRHRLRTVLAELGLPTSAAAFDADDILRAMLGDKKTERKTLRLVLTPAVGTAEVVRVDDETPVREAIRAAAAPTG